MWQSEELFKRFRIFKRSKYNKEKKINQHSSELLEPITENCLKLNPIKLFYLGKGIQPSKLLYNWKWAKFKSFLCNSRKTVGFYWTNNKALLWDILDHLVGNSFDTIDREFQVEEDVFGPSDPFVVLFVLDLKKEAGVK